MQYISKCPSSFAHQCDSGNDRRCSHWSVSAGRLRRFALILGVVAGCSFLAAAPGVVVGPSTFEAKQVDQVPLLKKKVKFRVPYALRKRGGEITLRILITPAGKVDKITVVKFSDPDLIEPVYSAYENAVYEPGMKNGEPVNTWVTVTEKTD